LSLEKKKRKKELSIRGAIDVSKSPRKRKKKNKFISRRKRGERGIETPYVPREEKIVW